jgi:hypothetical protein
MEMDVESDLPDLRPDIQLTLKIIDKIKHIVKFRRKNETLTVGLYLELFWYCYYFIGLRNQISILSVW